MLPLPLPGPIPSFTLCALLCILSLSLPPFPHRRTIFATLVTLTAALTHASPASPDPAITYAIGSLWPFYLSTLTKLLLHDPEAEFRCCGDAPGEAARWGFGWRKICWSTKLFADQRGVQWNFRGKGVPAAGRVGRWEFVAGRAVQGVLVAIAYDLCHTFVVKEYKLPGGEYISTRAGGLLDRAAIGLVNWAGIELNHVFLSGVSVALGLYPPEDWPPFFDSPVHFTTIGRFWGRVWHQTLRHSLTSTSGTVLSALRIPATHLLYHPVRLTTAFSITALGHAVPLRVMRPDRALPIGVITFYMLQAAGIYLESVVVNAYQRVSGGHAPVWGRFLGYVWVVTWFGWTLPFFWDDMFGVGIMDGNILPVSIASVVKRSLLAG